MGINQKCHRRAPVRLAVLAMIAVILEARVQTEAATGFQMAGLIHFDRMKPTDTDIETETPAPQFQQCGLPVQAFTSSDPAGEIEMEPGFFLSPNTDTGYLEIENKLGALTRIRINLKIKPRTPSGVILTVHGTEDYLVVQMINGTIEATVGMVGSGQKSMSSAWTSNDGVYALCGDGDWHSIQVARSKNVLTLAVDSEFARPAIGMGFGMKWAEEKGGAPIYIGGIPNQLGLAKAGIETDEQFVGCVKDLVIEGNGVSNGGGGSGSTKRGRIPMHLEYVNLFGNDACPMA